MNYPGKELEIFDTAKVFQKYIYFLIKKFIKSQIYEVGAGIGSFTSHYHHSHKNIYLSDLDINNYNTLKKKFSSNKRITIRKDKINKIKLKFNTIIYLNVLEHIKEDKKEIKTALSKLNLGGHLIILVPAHQKLYSKFDKAIGHCRRYDIKFFKSKNIKNVKIKKLIYLDMIGYVLYFFNKVFFKEEVYPSYFKVFLWDKLFSPLTIILDFITGYKFGKNVLCVYEKVN
ncbi:methyltransferase domain-containing protein [Pelagibacteraceae bacterium]|nr:methyltransferase domain-containing protein [Pelagibacteraceae bacterium]